MYCAEAQAELALWVGHDLTDPVRIEQVRRHVAVCPACAERVRALQSSLVALGSLEAQRTFDTAESLWPELSSRLDARESARPSRSWLTSWVVGGASVAVLGGLFVLWKSSEPREPVATPSVPATVPVAETPVPVPPHHSPGQRSPGME